jgi:glutamate synthase (ferredoxin)
VVELGLQGLARLRHRGAFAADEQTGDGAGVLFPIPRRLIAHAVGATLAEASQLGLLMLFICDKRSPGEVCAAVEDALGRERLRVVRWRDVPVDPSALGDHARDTRPRILQAVLSSPSTDDAARSEQRAHRARRRIDAFARAADRDVYVASCSFATITYKALAAADRLAAFYPDLLDPDVEAPFVVFHQRYSTNTAPTWERAQPFRMLCHNGEINTIAGNANRLHAREGRLGLATLAEEALFRPAIDDAGSDSAILDETVEILAKEGGVRGVGRDIRRAVAMVVPAAWEDAPDMDPERRGFYRWHSSLMEPWDGPAALIFTDGVAVGAALDRNGLRPLRYWATDDGLVVCASEAGVVDLPEGHVRRGKLGPGQMIVVDPRNGGLDDDAIRAVASEAPWAAWAEEHRIARLPEMPRLESRGADELVTKQIMHGYTREDLSMMIRPAAAHGKEPTFSMGDDTPLAALSSHDRSIFNHLRQRFAQVTNPAMDHLRERSVMSLAVLLGPRAPLLNDDPGAAALEEFESFFRWERPSGRRLDATWRAGRGASGLRAALRRLGSEAVAAVADGEPILVVSDVDAGPDRAPIPSVLSVGAVNVALTNAGLRTCCSIVAEADDARESHHVACLLAVGAEAVRLPLAAATVAALARGAGDDEAASAALARYREAIEDGIRKTLAKLGISCVDSYRGAEVVDVLGLDDEIARTCFVSTRAVLGGLGLDDVAAGVLERLARAFGASERSLANPGYVKFRNGGEHHAAEPAVVRAAHRIADPTLERLRTNASGAKGQAADDEMDAAHALNLATKAPDRPALYARYAAIVHGRPPTAIRDLLELVSRRDVDTARRGRARRADPRALLDRRHLARVDLGGSARDARARHERDRRPVQHGRGRGGSRALPDREELKIKQIASGRFGVTPEYCAFAEELQIKIAQGSKPGEGGQLPGHKVTDEIARLRHTQPGVALISPAPHHDIYSIEDLAQLVFDLKQVNPGAVISVKLVAEEGVGAVALGVAKALADVVHIAGADGGTGASPLSSIKNAGLPWELGLVEAQREMAESGLRSRVRLRVDGGLKTGRDVMVAALLGADEYSFGTAALLAEGCLMVRTCHLDTCPVGIATQRPELRAKFAGTPEMVEAFMRAVAEEVRELLACLGFRSLDDVIGRVDLLRARDVDAPSHRLDIEPLLRRPLGERRSIATDAIVRPASVLGDRLFDTAWPAIRDGAHVELELPITNGDRAVGARLGGAIGRTFGMAPPPGSVRARFHGTAGQSFGAFLADGIELRLSGEANDYVGKGMGGGRIAIAAPPEDAGDPWLAGNTVLYGATGGELFIAGRTGERFAVRNSGALAVVEGVGDHACEYMTGGTVVVLGPVGRNLAAGMTGGELFVHDPHGHVPIRLNPELVEAKAASVEALERLHLLVRRHHELTGSLHAAALLAEWDRHAGGMLHVRPRPDLATIVGVQEGTRVAAMPSRDASARPLRSVGTS